MPLLLTVVLHQLRILSAVLFQVIAMFIPPLLLAFAHHLAIHGVDRKLLAVIIGPALTLTLRLTADLLLGTVNRGQK